MNDPVYIHISSNHPNNIIKELPKSINKRISEISSTEEIYKNAMPLYEKALKTTPQTIIQLNNHLTNSKSRKGNENVK